MKFTEQQKNGLRWAAIFCAAIGWGAHRDAHALDAPTFAAGAGTFATDGVTHNLTVTAANARNNVLARFDNGFNTQVGEDLQIANNAGGRINLALYAPGVLVSKGSIHAPDDTRVLLIGEHGVSLDTTGQSVYAAGGWVIAAGTVQVADDGALQIIAADAADPQLAGVNAEYAHFQTSTPPDILATAEAYVPTGEVTEWGEPVYENVLAGWQIAPGKDVQLLAPAVGRGAIPFAYWGGNPGVEAAGDWALVNSSMLGRSDGSLFTTSGSVYVGPDATPGYSGWASLLAPHIVVDAPDFRGSLVVVALDADSKVELKQWSSGTLNLNAYDTPVAVSASQLGGRVYLAGPVTFTAPELLVAASGEVTINDAWTLQVALPAKLTALGSMRITAYGGSGETKLPDEVQVGPLGSVIVNIAGPVASNLWFGSTGTLRVSFAEFLGRPYGTFSMHKYAPEGGFGAELVDGSWSVENMTTVGQGSNYIVLAPAGYVAPVPPVVPVEPVVPPVVPVVPPVVPVEPVVPVVPPVEPVVPVVPVVPAPPAALAFPELVVVPQAAPALGGTESDEPLVDGGAK